VKIRHTLVGAAAFVLFAIAAPAATSAATLSAPAAAVAQATSIVLTATPTPAVVGQAVTLSAVISPAGAGTVTFTDTQFGALGSASVDATTGQASLAVPTLSPGTHTLTAHFAGSTDLSPVDSAPLSLVVAPGTSSGSATTTTLTATPNPSVATNLVTIRATVNPAPDTGTVIFTEGNTVLGTAGVDPATGDATLRISTLTVGSHAVVATFTGSTTFAGSASGPIAMVVVRDSVVEASGLGLSASSIYPVVDGYKDTVQIHGVLKERASVSIAIYSPAGKRVRNVALGTLQGRYAWTWNGRSNSGSQLAAGRYMVVQTLRDRAHNVLTDTRFIVVSTKRLVYLTAAYSQYGDQYAKWDSSAFGWVEPGFSVFPRGVDIYGNIDDQWAGVGYWFNVPSAVTYKAIKFEVLGQVDLADGGPATVSVWNAADAQGDGLRSTGYTYGWYGTHVSGPSYVDHGHVEAFVLVDGADQGPFDIAKVRLTVTYGVLR
jgi:hypothetical protein